VQRGGDSHGFQEHAIRLTEAARDGGPAVLLEDFGQQLRHIQILAAVYYATGSTNAWFVYVLNALMAGLSVWLTARLARAVGLSERVAAVLGALLGCSPQFLFMHSELLREPFILPPLQMIWLSCVLLMLPEARPGAGLMSTALAAIGLGIGFIGSVVFRPYLMVPLLASLTLVGLLSIAWRLLTQLRQRSWRPGHAAFSAVVILLAVGFVMPSAPRVEKYATVDVVSSADRLAETAPRTPKSPVSVGCTVGWRASGWLPDRVERMLESASCAREEFQRYCDSRLYAVIDRNCDLKVLTSAGDTIRHLPSAAAFSLLVPLPNMWLDAFGASGTGLRRVGYVVDGIVSYALLPGLIALIAYSFRDRRFVPLVLVALGIVTAIVIYGIAVPSQFILARMRLGFYRPLLVIAAVGWVLFLQERFCRRWHRFA
jgi:hypothetical protein